MLGGDRGLEKRGFEEFMKLVSFCYCLQLKQCIRHPSICTCNLYEIQLGMLSAC